MLQLISNIVEMHRVDLKGMLGNELFSTIFMVTIDDWRLIIKVDR